jgi:peptidoglycan/xylan/chitin deacetylase (PgdA/CDA1 family)
MPAIERWGVPVTVFLLTGCVGRENLWNPKAYTVERHLTAQEIGDLQNLGVDFQLHGVDHHRLTKFDEATIESIFERGQRDFKGLFKRDADVIAYPYGAFDETVLAVARRFFAYGLSVTQGRWGGRGSRYCLNRVEVTGWMGPELLPRLLSCPRRERAQMYREWRDETRGESGSDR